MYKKYLTLCSISAAIFLFSSCGNSSSDVIIQNDNYPDGAVIEQFKELESQTDSLKRIAEIDFFSGSQVPVGDINDIEVIGDNIYIADRKQDLVHVIDRQTLKYKKSIGGAGPNQLIQLFGMHVADDNNLLIGNAAGPYLLKKFSPEGAILESVRDNDQTIIFKSPNINEFFISDSIAYVTTWIPDNGNKLVRYNFLGGEANKIDAIVPVTDLHTAELDSATLSTIIPKMSVLKSNLIDSVFYVVPANKYLINSYNLEGDKLSSVDLRGIPQVNKAYKVMKKTPNSSYFNSAVIDDGDNIYLHFPDYEDLDISEDETMEEASVKIVNSKSKLKLLSLNPIDKTFRTFNTEARNVAPLKIIDGKLWCFDIISSQLVIYQLPEK